MTREQFANVLAFVEASWPRHPIRDDTAAVWWGDLGTYDLATVIAAVRSLYRAGREFPPNSAHIIAEIADQTIGAPAFGAAWAAITQAVRTIGSHHEQRVLAALGNVHPAVAELASEIGIRQIGLSAEGDTSQHAQARERYAAVLRRRHRAETHAGLPSAAGSPAPNRALVPASGAVADLAETLVEGRP